jgi:hypothetical protein
MDVPGGRKRRDRNTGSYNNPTCAFAGSDLDGSNGIENLRLWDLPV